MLTHYLKISIRNLMKYKMQSFISIFGLAVGFVCFALSLIWIQYETTYDSQYKDSDSRFLLYNPSSISKTGYSFSKTYTKLQNIKNEFPEIKSFIALDIWKNDVNVDGVKHSDLNYLLTDSSFIDIFGLKLLKGSLDFLHDDSKSAITESCAMRLFGTTDVVGKQYEEDFNKETFTIGAVFKDLPHSNYSFDIWGRCEYFENLKKKEYAGIGEAVLILHKDVDINKLLDKMHTCKNKRVMLSVNSAGLLPLTDYHYSELNPNNKLQFHYLILFAAIGVLIIFCALFNYLSIFVIRLGIRRKEIGLRKVCGANWAKLYSMFSVEYGLFLIISIFVSLTLTSIIRPSFEEISGVTGSLYLPFISYWAIVALISLFALIFLVRHYALSGASVRESLMRKLSVFFQLTISILMMFCMVVLMKQITFLQKGDLGWTRRNIATFSYIYPSDKLEEITQRLSSFASVDTLISHTLALAPSGMRMSNLLTGWDGRVDTTRAKVPFEIKLNADVVIPFYNIKIVEGMLPKKGNKKSVVVNEAFVKATNMADPVGKHFRTAANEDLEIAGVVENSYINPPTVPATIMVFSCDKQDDSEQMLIRVNDGQWDEFEIQVHRMFAADYPDVDYKLINTEKWYDEFLYSEHMLVKLLTAVSLVCVLIAAFGIYSLIMLSCERRRKEIAVRKVNGAKVKDILFIFIREYVALLVMASVIAFPIGYALMKQWLVTYIRQTPISFWIYAIIFLGISLLISLCIGWRVWKVSRINPAEVIKSE